MEYLGITNVDLEKSIYVLSHLLLQTYIREGTEYNRTIHKLLKGSKKMYGLVKNEKNYIIRYYEFESQMLSTYISDFIRVIYII